MLSISTTISTTSYHVISSPTSPFAALCTDTESEHDEYSDIEIADNIDGESISSSNDNHNHNNLQLPSYDDISSTESEEQERRESEEEDEKLLELEEKEEEPTPAGLLNLLNLLNLHQFVHIVMDHHHQIYAKDVKLLSIAHHFYVGQHIKRNVMEMDREN